jgi:hypothetical protein
VDAADQEEWKAFDASDAKPNEGANDEEWKAFEAPDAKPDFGAVEDPFVSGAVGDDEPFADFSQMDAGGGVPEEEEVRDSGFEVDVGGAAMGGGNGQEEVLEELSGGDPVDLQYLSDMKPMAPSPTAAVVEEVAEEPMAETSEEPEPISPTGL